MSKLRIFIEGEELDSLETVTVPITKQYEELSDPTVICNDYSKTVTVPLSKRNNEIFGHVYNIDRLIISSSDDIPLVGIYFDPYKKLDCRLQWGDDVFFTGYAKMLKVTNNGYEVTINGELGKVFQELQKLTFDKEKYDEQEDIEKYYIDGSKYVNSIINSDLVYKCWNSSQNDYTLREVSDANYDITDIIGFIPNNSFSSDFDYSTVELSDGTSKSMSDVLGEDFETNTGYSRDSVIGDGLYPVQMGQFRSYEQIPFIYWNKFWQIFANEGERLTGYKWIFDDKLDEYANFRNLGITLLQRDSMNIDEDKICDENFSVSFQSAAIPFNKSYSSTTIVMPDAQGAILCKDGYFQVNDGELLMKLDTSFNIEVNNPFSGTTIDEIQFYKVSTSRMCALHVSYKYNDEVLIDYIYCNSSDVDYWASIYASSNIQGIKWKDLSIGYLKTGVINFPGSGDVNIKLPSYNGKLTVEFSPLINGTDTTYNGNIFYVTYKSGSTIGSQIYTANTGALQSKVIVESTDLYWYKTYFRSGSKFTLNDICNLDFSNILDYCKRYRIHIYVDEISKILHFTRSYFNDYSIKDMSDKIDKTTFDIQTTTFDSKYILFDYSDDETCLGKSYNEIYDYHYGAKRINTNYNFNTETTTLFETSKETILYSPSYLYWGDLVENSIMKKKSLNFWIYNNNFLECRDESGNTTDISGAYIFPTKKKIDRHWVVTVTDDSDKMSQTDTYYNYKQTTGMVVEYWTSPELVKQTTDIIPVQYYTCLFTKPNKNYTANLAYYDKANGVYDNYWKVYLNERYNIQNKQLTTYIKLSPIDFMDFKFNQFWKIENQIYIVNKIYDYDITSDDTTKVDLITVQNIEAYKN